MADDDQQSEAKQVATIGCTFSGYCSKHHHGSFTGTFDDNGSVVMQLNDKDVCVTGTTGTASCGCTVRAIGKSVALQLNGLAVARVTDPIENADGSGSIKGVITSGVDFLAIN